MRFSEMIEQLMGQGMTLSDIEQATGRIHAEPDGSYRPLKGRTTDAVQRLHAQRVGTARQAPAPAQAGEATPAERAHRVGRSLGVDGGVWDESEMYR